MDGLRTFPLHFSVLSSLLHRARGTNGRRSSPVRQLLSRSIPNPSSALPVPELHFLSYEPRLPNCPANLGSMPIHTLLAHAVCIARSSTARSAYFMTT